MVLKLLDKQIIEDGNAWESLILDCFITRYKTIHNVQPIDADPGDGGIEGFVSNGIVWQCYAPKDSNLSNDDLYKALIKKITEDIKKLYKVDNITLYKSVGVPLIKEWHFITPRYTGQKILSHLQKKQQEVRKKIRDDKLTHIDPNFIVSIKDANEFKTEINQLYINNLLSLDFKLHSLPIDYEDCDSEKKENIRRKNNSLASPHSLPYLVDLNVKQYLKYLAFETKLLAIESLRERFIGSVEQLKTGTTMALLRSTDYKITYNQQIDIIKDNLLYDFNNIFSSSEAFDISNMIMSKWLADCNLDFLIQEDGE